jgi:hypothetical protein
MTHEMIVLTHYFILPRCCGIYRNITKNIILAFSHEAITHCCRCGNYRVSAGEAEALGRRGVNTIDTCQAQHLVLRGATECHWTDTCGSLFMVGLLGCARDKSVVATTTWFYWTRDGSLCGTPIFWTQRR